ncbi:hypothetical protein PCK2_000079, partial [Pneumocystis canis]
RALDCTAALPLVNSLSHLSFLTSTSSRIREILAEDEGLERLVRLLQEGRHSDRLEAWKWQLAFQCIVNVGIRGSENVRTRVVEADVVPVIATVLDEFLQHLEQSRSEMIRDTNQRWLRHATQESIHEETDEMSFLWHTPSFNMDLERRHGLPPIESSTIQILRTVSADSDDANSDEIISSHYHDLRPLQHPPVDLQTLEQDALDTSLSAMPVHSIDHHDQNTNTIHDEFTLLSHSYSFHSLENSAFSNTVETHGENEMHLSNTIHDPHTLTVSPAPQPQPLLLDSRHFFFKNEDNIVFCLQLLAYISKYPQLRSYFQNSHDIPKLRYYHADADEAKVMPMNDHDPELLKDFYYQDDRRSDGANVILLESLKISDIDLKIEKLKLSVGLYKEYKDFSFEIKIKNLEEHIKLLELQKTFEIEFHESFIGLSVNETVFKLIKLNQMTSALKIKSDFKIPVKRFWWIKLRALVAIRDWAQIEDWVNKSNKSPIGYEPFISECLAAGNKKIAASFIPKCSKITPEFRVELWTKVGDWISAGNEALKYKNMKLFENLKSKAPINIIKELEKLTLFSTNSSK